MPTHRKRHLIILGIRGVPAAHGGFESFAERLVPWLTRRGWSVTVYCQGSSTGARYEDTWKGCRRVHVPVRIDGAAGTIEFDVKATREAVKRRGALLLTLGYNTAFLSMYAKLRGCVNVINMDGIEWKRAKYSRAQKVYLWMNERLAARSGDALVADHPQIAKHHAEHACAKKITMIPYGSDAIVSPDPSLLSPFGVEPDRFFTVIARPEPENSVLEIVRAFSRNPREMKLVVLGNYRRDHPYQNSVLEAAGDRVLFPGAIYDKPTLNALRAFSRAYAHGHQVGGTNPSLVEALGAGNAIIAHDNIFNRWVAGEAALYFADEDECEARFALLNEQADLRWRLREAAHVRWEATFTWPDILSQYEDLLVRMHHEHS